MTAEGRQSALAGAYTGTPGTVESSNLVYSQLPSGASRQFVQRFARRDHLNDPAGTTATSAAATGPIANGAACPPGQTFNSLSKGCQSGRGHTVDYDQAPRQAPN